MERFIRTSYLSKRENFEILPLWLRILVYFSKENPINFLGWIHLLPVKDDRQATEIGWRLKYSAWGNGYATEAAQVIIAHAFSIADFNRIVAYTHSANNRSIKMMNRLGLKYIDDLIYNGKTPSLFYEIRREKYYQKE